MNNVSKYSQLLTIPEFKNDIFTGEEACTRIGNGEIGGKASGLILLRDMLKEQLIHNKFPDVLIDIPRFTIITTHFFDVFMEENDLYEIAFSDESDERIAHHFQAATLPADLIGSLWTIVSKIHTPLAIRSSSLLEDTLQSPYAGIYETKMISNNQPDTESRFRKLIEAVKYVYSSTYFKKAKEYSVATSNNFKQEKMAVIIQEVVGLMHGNRFYPNISGVARSLNYYPFGRLEPEDGIVSLALGLGKTIVDGGLCWSYSPQYPDLSFPYGSIKDLLKNTQTDFWAINMSPLIKYDPVNETEYLVKLNIKDAEYDNVLTKIASTYDVQSDRICIGTFKNGPRIINFAPILQLDELPINRVIKEILPICSKYAGGPVEIEFSIIMDNFRDAKIRFSLLQVRRIANSRSNFKINKKDFNEKDVFVKSDVVLGNGVIDNIKEVVYVKRESFDFKYSTLIASHVGIFNKRLLKQGLPYLLIGPGRWGSTDPWLGIPVKWGQISGAKIIVESYYKDRYIDFSQGSHFFHNLSSLDIIYFYVKGDDKCYINWEWLEEQKVKNESEYIKHIHLDKPVKVIVSSKDKLGVVLK